MSSGRAVDVFGSRVAVVDATEAVVSFSSQKVSSSSHKQSSGHCNKYIYQSIRIITCSVTETYDILIISFLDSWLGYSNSVFLSTWYILHVYVQYLTSPLSFHFGIYLLLNMFLPIKEIKHYDKRDFNLANLPWAK